MEDYEQHLMGRTAASEAAGDPKARHAAAHKCVCGIPQQPLPQGRTPGSGGQLCLLFVLAGCLTLMKYSSRVNMRGRRA